MKDSIIYKGHVIKYHWTTSNRKTMGIYFEKNGDVVVKTPYHISQDEVEKFITDNGDKVLKFQEDVKKEFNEIAAHTYQDGDIFYYQGEEYLLCFNANRPAVKENSVAVNLDREWSKLDMFFRRSAWSPEEIKEIMERWYRERAKKLFEERTEYFAKIMGCTYGTISIKNQKTRYGSCSAQGNLNYNWRIVMAPPKVLDYIVVHELCHRFEMNHSRRFWAQVKKYMPDYEEQEKWLKENRHKIAW